MAHSSWEHSPAESAPKPTAAIEREFACPAREANP